MVGARAKPDREATGRVLRTDCKSLCQAHGSHERIRGGSGHCAAGHAEVDTVITLQRWAHPSAHHLCMCPDSGKEELKGNDEGALVGSSVLTGNWAPLGGACL